MRRVLDVAHAYEDVTAVYGSKIDACLAKNGVSVRIGYKSNTTDSFGTVRYRLETSLAKLDPYIDEMPLNMMTPLWQVNGIPVSLYDDFGVIIEVLDTVEPWTDELANQTVVIPFLATTKEWQFRLTSWGKRFRPRLNETERRILKAVGKSRLNGQQIADKAGLPLNSHTKATLARMVDVGLLDNEPNPRTGYFDPLKYKGTP